MPKGSRELTDARREEIVNACEELYKTKSFREITIKEIGSLTDFSRTSVYNYFQTKEEIFLALLKREYELWTRYLNDVTAKTETMTAKKYADVMARSLGERPQLLKIVSMNHYDTERFSRPEHLTEFKKAYGASMRAVGNGLKKFFPDMTDGDRKSFIYAFFPFMFGIYAYATVTDKQKKAMEEAEVDYTYMSVYELVFNCVKRLLGRESEI